MLRFVAKRFTRDRHSGSEWDGLKTFDVVAPELEKFLRGGGFGEGSADCRTLVGVEILDDTGADGPS
jgi:hypothetical protein